MVRAPCCEKMGLKKGPWTRDEDQILINHVSLYGHSNWRALPKQAGLLRCGKSCRLRWTNYLRPDIKRGNFSEQEEETIINLHGVLGNRWSAIAARLPGRTDNEIKNVWHTHLKKRVKKIQETPESNQNSIKISIPEHDTAEVENPTEINYEAQPKSEEQHDYPVPNSPQQESSSITQTKSENQEYYPPNSPPQVSSVSTTTTTTTATTTSEEGSSTCMNAETLHDFLQDEGFWSDVFSAETSNATSDFPVVNPFQNTEFGYESNSNNMNEGMDIFWYDIFTRSAGELPELPEF